MSSTERNRRHRERRRQLCLFLLGGRCIECGATDRLEFAHKKPTRLTGAGRGSKERYRDVLAFTPCYQLLRRDCHAKTPDYCKPRKEIEIPE